MKTIQKTLILFLTVMLTSCAIMPICQSSKLSENDTEILSNTTFFDRNTNLEFRVADNETNLQLILVFDSLCLQKINDKGFYLYFDPKGKKKREYSLKIFPEKNELKKSAVMKRPVEMEKNSPRLFPELNKSCEEKFTSAIWKTTDNIYAFDIRFSIHPINVKTKALENGLWQVKVTIPLSELSPNPIQYLSLGVETPKASTANSSERPAMMGGMGQGMGGGMMGGPGGGMPGGGPGGNRPASGMNPVNMNGENNSAGAGQLSSWIKVYL